MRKLAISMATFHSYGYLLDQTVKSMTSRQPEACNVDTNLHRNWPEWGLHLVLRSMWVCLRLKGIKQQNPMIHDHVPYYLMSICRSMSIKTDTPHPFEASIFKVSSRWLWKMFTLFFWVGHRPKLWYPVVNKQKMTLHLYIYIYIYIYIPTKDGVFP